MPYLPPGTIPITGADNILPRSNHVDLWRAVATIEERWSRFYPTLSYLSLLKGPQSAPAAKLLRTDPVLGQTGTTQHDPLWGDTIAPNLQGGTWKQPHASVDTSPVVQETELFRPEVLLKFKVERELPESDLHRYGFDRVRDLLVTIPSSFFDRVGLTAQAGDVIRWDNRDFSVLQQTAYGYWFNTNVPLYVILNCQHRRKGS